MIEMTEPTLKKKKKKQGKPGEMKQTYVPASPSKKGKWSSLVGSRER